MICCRSCVVEDGYCCAKSSTKPLFWFCNWTTTSACSCLGSAAVCVSSAGRLEVRLAGGVEIDVGVLRVYAVQPRQDARKAAHHVIERAILHDQHDHVTNGIVVWHWLPLLPGAAPVMRVFYNARARVPHYRR